MAAKEYNFYFARNKDGFLCSYDKKTHRCIGVMLSTGDNIEIYNKHHDSYIGQLDPNYDSSEKTGSK